MNFEPIPEHEALRDSVRSFFDRELPETKIREMDRARRIPRELWNRPAELGWPGLTVPTEYGGSGGDVTISAILTEEIARRFPSLANYRVIVAMTARVLRRIGHRKAEGGVSAQARQRPNS